jgi:hypothetical protein
MKIERTQLDTAVHRGIISDSQARALWSLLLAEQKNHPQFSFNQVLYYLGGMVAIGGISVFVTLGWETLGGIGLFAVALAVMAVAAWLTHHFLVEQKLAIPAGLMAALIVAAAPLAIYGLQRMLGYWPPNAPYRSYHTIIDYRWIVMELGTLAVGAAVLWRWRLPFSVMPVAATLWYMSMDLAPLLQTILAGNVDPNDPQLSYDQKQDLWNSYWKLRQWVSVVVGLFIAGGAIAVDLRDRGRSDYAFWLHLAGVAAFWGGLTSMNSGSELGKLIYFLINVSMLLFGTAIGRRVYTVFVALGIAAYLGQLAYEVFKDSLVFPVALMLIGLGVVWLGVIWQRHERAINSALQRWLPERLRTTERQV